jgi:hypothetical protein
VASLLFALILPAKWVTVGLAVALSFSYYIGAWTTIRLLHRYRISIHLGEVVGFYSRLAGIYALIGVPLYLVLGRIPGGNSFKLLVVLGISGVGYLGIAKVFKITEVGTAFALFLKPKNSL